MVRNMQKKQGEAGALPIPETVAATRPVTGVRAGEPTTKSIKPPEAQEAGSFALIEARWKFADETHKYIREYIRLADQKAGFIFTACAALLALLYQKGVFQYLLKPPNEWHFSVLALLSVLCLSLAAFSSICVVVPRFKGHHRGYIFWNSIAGYEYSTQYYDTISDLSQSDLIRAKLEHCYELAKVCRSKYVMLRWSFLAGLFSLFFLVPLLLFLK